MIIRGFLDMEIEGLGRELDARIAGIAELAGHSERESGKGDAQWR